MFSGVAVSMLVSVHMISSDEIWGEGFLSAVLLSNLSFGVLVFVAESWMFATVVQ